MKHRGGSIGIVVILACAWMSAGCATITPSSQSFVEVQSLNFDIVSSLGDAQTRELARKLEFFHAGVLAVLGTDETPPRHARTRVLAFDDRSLGRPFAVRGAAAYYLPEVDAGMIVFRTPGGWGARATRDLRTAYAHRLIRSRSSHRLPLWVEHGLAQVASAIVIRDGDVGLGALIEQHVQEVQDWRRASFSWVVQTTDLSQASEAERARFEAFSWSLAHTLMFPAPARRTGLSFPKMYLETFDAAMTGEGQRAADALLGGDGEELASRVHDHLEQTRFGMRVVRPIGWDPQALELRTMTNAEARGALAGLALALDRRELADEFFEKALADEAEDARALAGLALARLDDFEDAESLAGRALASGEGDAQVRLLVGRLYAEAAEASDDPRESARRLEQARAQLRASLEIDRQQPRPRVELGLSQLAEGGDPELGLEWLRSAATLRPGSLRIDLARARLEARAGKRAAARFAAREVVSRAQSVPLREEAETLLFELE